MKEKCTKCGMANDGYKCDRCGAESKSHDANHKPCGGERCLVKCSGCSSAESKCSC